jgi:hypothetical protein
MTKKEFNVVSYKSAGPIDFGMSIVEIENIFNKKPDYSSRDFINRIELKWDNIFIKFKNDKVNEISFMEGDKRVFWDGYDILGNENIIDHLEMQDIPFDTVGFKVFFKFGIALTGYGKNKESKLITVFEKELIPMWNTNFMYNNCCFQN